MKLLEVFPPNNTVELVSRYFVDLGEAGRWKYFSAEALLFYIALFLVIYTILKKYTTSNAITHRSVEKILLSDWLFLLSVLGFILMSRIPLVILGIQNADESLWIASAKTLYHDPRPWVSVDTGTGGPLVPFMLIMLKLIGLPIDHGSLKVMSALIMALSLLFLYLGFGLTLGRTLARIVILPLAVAVSVMVSNDMIAYNSEHPVILLFSISFLFLARLYTSGKGKFNINLILLGIALGLVPFTKLQGAPIAVCIGLVGCLIAYKKISAKSMLTLVACGLIPTMLFGLLVWSYGGLSEFWFSYVENNLSYAGQTSQESGDFGYRMNIFFTMLAVPTELHFFLYYSFTVILFGLSFIIATAGKLLKEDIVKLIFVLVLLLITIYCIVAPGRNFTHYLLLLIIPITITLAVIVQLVSQVLTKQIQHHALYKTFLPVSLVLIYVCLSSFYYFQTTFTYTPAYLAKANEYYNGYSVQNNVTAVLARYAEPNQSMAIWGWAPELFEETDFLMGTRDCASSFQIEEGPHQSRLLTRYISDLNKNKPKLFVEAISPTFFGFQDRSKSGFENYPDLKAYISNNYTLDSEVNGARIFVRNDKLNMKTLWVSQGFGYHPTVQEFHSDLQTFEINGSYLQFKGWTVLGRSSDNQKVNLVLINKGDTILMKAYQQVNKSVVDFAPQNKGFLMCGFLGYLPLKEIPSGIYQVGLLVENEDQIAFKLLGKDFINPITSSQ